MLPFAPGERVLCYHGPLVYEAKVLKAESWDETNTQLGTVGPHFFVHYKGWKQTWDEWVPSSRLLKFNEENIAMQKRLVAESKQAAAAAAASTATLKTSKSTSNLKAASSSYARKEGTRGTKRSREDDDSNRRPDLKLDVPEILKVRLVDDWEAVTKNNQLVTLPREPNVEMILEEYRDYVLSLQKPPMSPATLLPTVISGLLLYFNRCIGANLLYRFERPQYAAARKQYKTGQHVIIEVAPEMTGVYGAEHLLRMIVSLPGIIAHSTMDQGSVQILKDYVQELMNFMVQERERLFQKEYETAGTQYQNVARS